MELKEKQKNIHIFLLECALFSAFLSVDNPPDIDLVRPKELLAGEVTNV